MPQPGGCPTGEARITAGYNLTARWVIHTVGPVWRGGSAGEDELLAACYRSCLSVAVDHGIRTVAFPSISTGAYGFPIERASRIALSQISRFLDADESIEKVSVVCFGERDRQVYLAAVKELADS